MNIIKKGLLNFKASKKGYYILEDNKVHLMANENSAKVNYEFENLEELETALKNL